MCGHPSKDLILKKYSLSHVKLVHALTKRTANQYIQIFNIIAEVSDLEAFLNGWSQHESALTPGQKSLETKWEYIGYIQVYISYFFVRASVLLFALRLLPTYKKVQQRIIYAVFLVNFLVTAYTCVTFGVSCIPFKANWESVPNSKCFSKDVLVVTNQINAALACVCDVATAVIPIFLLWNVQMRPKTKRQLNVIFALSLITAPLSIGRAASLTKKTLTEDTTWNMVPSYYFSMFEIKLGLIFACGPAIRQFWAYRTRTKSSLPTNRRQYPNEDFEKMRYRINLRDIFWYRKAPMVGDKVFEAARMFQNKPPQSDASSSKRQNSSKISNSVLDVWEKRIKRVMGASRDQEVIYVQVEPYARGTGLQSILTTFQASCNGSSGNPDPSYPKTFEKQDPTGVSRPNDLSSKKPRTSRRWGLFSHKSENSTNSTSQAPFLLSNSETGASATMTTLDEPYFPIYGTEIADEHGNPKMQPTYRSGTGQ
ncbi:MAG: hypothetical protein Q9218_004781 [Villophora microphyllina]